VASLTAAVAHSWQWRRTGLAVRGRLRVDPFSEAVACELENCAREQVRGEADVASMTTAVAHLWQWNGHGSSGASAADAASAGCAHHAPQQRPPLPPAEKVACGVREAHPDKAEEALEAMTTLIRQSLGPWIHLQTAVVVCARARLQNTASPQLSFVAVDGKSAEINGIIAALVQLLFDFRYTFACMCMRGRRCPSPWCDKQSVFSCHAD